ncbi:MAG: DMT family transporter [Pyrobaculum sp.]
MLGITSAVASAVAFSINAPLAYAAARRGVTSQTLVAVRNFVALAMTAPFAQFNVPASVVAVVVASALLGPGLGDYAYFKAISSSGVASAVTVAYTYILTAQVFSALLGVERLGANDVLGAVLAMLGVLVAVGGRPRGTGFYYGVVASLAWGAASALLGAASKSASPFTVAAIRSATLVPIFLLFSSFSNVRSSGLLYAVASGVVGLGAGSLAFIYAMSQIGVGATVVATAITPILSQVFDRVINKTPMSPKHILGALLVGAGIAVVMTD